VAYCGVFAVVGVPSESAAQPLTCRSLTIVTYALCGFSNLGSIGMTLAAMTPVVPTRAADLTELAGISMIAGMCANYLNAAIAGMLI